VLFNSFAFWLFFAAVFLLCHAVPRGRRVTLVASSFAFYGMWDPRLMMLLAGCVGFNFASGLAIARAGPRHARPLLALAVAGNLGVLGLFKYYGFFAANVAALFAMSDDAIALHIILPVAISFYTFEAISYNVDIYRGDVPARSNLLDFALFLSFFPHLVAGPIIRPAHFFPQLDRPHMLTAEDLRWGTLQAVKGLIKKCVFADNLAVVANTYFDGAAHGQHAGMAAAWAGTLAFSGQIYFDFAGYTDIARGCARLLGYEFPPNFERPYLAGDIAAFWRRWHISLSTWLRDYLYIPLGGNRRGAKRIYVNLLITMGLGGLWHGASWNFLLWGLYHGGLLSVHRVWRQWYPRERGGSGVGHAMSVAATFLCVTLGWTAFRSPDFTTTAQVLTELLAGSTQPAQIPSGLLIPAAASILWVWIDRDRRLQEWLSRGRGVLGTIKVSVAFALALLVLELFARTDIAVPFIYFRF
jgi:D-alanyl-lipoteichoic acid acyltransferase DltB (MBOAT superfamily)